MVNQYLGIDIGGTKSAVLIGGSDGTVLARRQWPSEAGRGPEAMLQEIERHAKALLSELQPVQACGVSIGGPLDAERGIILSPPNLPGWEEIRLKERLEKEIGAPVNVEHDAAACALAEVRWGAGRGSSRVVYLTCGTGFGAGFVIDGKIYRGAGGRSPEVGHWRYAQEGPAAFGKTGSVEAYCSGSGLPKLAAWRYPLRWGENPPSGAELFRLAQAGDDEAQEILRINACAVGHTCAKIADLFRPDCLILGSLARYLGPSWMGTVRDAFGEEALPGSLDRVKICPPELGDRLQDCSALAAALARL